MGSRIGGRCARRRAHRVRVEPGVSLSLVWGSAQAPNRAFALAQQPDWTICGLGGNDAIRIGPEPVVDIYAGFGRPAPQEFQEPDGLHPTLAEHQVLAREFVERLVGWNLDAELRDPAGERRWIRCTSG